LRDGGRVHACVPTQAHTPSSTLSLTCSSGKPAAGLRGVYRADRYVPSILPYVHVHGAKDESPGFVSARKISAISARPHAPGEATGTSAVEGGLGGPEAERVACVQQQPAAAGPAVGAAVAGT
jgi:hypothetical protein